MDWQGLIYLILAIFGWSFCLVVLGAGIVTLPCIYWGVEGRCERAGRSNLCPRLPVIVTVGVLGVAVAIAIILIKL